MFADKDSHQLFLEPEGRGTNEYYLQGFSSSLPLETQLDALQKALEMDKATFLYLKKEEIIPFIEEEIVVRYYFQEAGIKIRLRYDEQLHEALKQPAITLT